jgi:hypothetical protein
VDSLAVTAPIPIISGTASVGKASPPTGQAPLLPEAARPAILPIPARPPVRQQAGRRRLAGGRVYQWAAALVLLVAAGSLTFVLSRSATPSGGSGVGQDRAGAASQIRHLAVAWIAAQVSRTAVVSCDPVMCRALEAHGIPAGQLLELQRAANPLSSAVIVATAAVRGQFAGQLSSEYAPDVIRIFGSGSLRIEIRVIAAHGAAAYKSALATDLRARKTSGAQLLSSPRIGVSAMAARQLSSGQVDARLLVTIAGLAALEPIRIVTFGYSAPGASAGIPLRSADIADTGQTARMRAAYVHTILTFLHGQSAPYLAARTGILRLAGGQLILRIEFAAPSPLGLLNPTTPGHR